MSAATTAYAVAAGGGVALIVQWWRARTPTLEARIGARLRPVGARIGAERGVPSGARWPFPSALGGANRLAQRWAPAPGDLSARLRRSGSSLTPEEFRAHQVVWGLSGLGLGMLLSIGLAFRGSPAPSLVLLVATFGVTGAVARDYALTRAVARREARMLAELPTVADMLALSVSAGEGVLGALERVCRRTSGALAEEFRGLLGDVRTGTGLAEALHGLAARTGLAPLARFATGVGIAVERGTPLADVLHAQAMDVREAGRRRLIEEGGKREIAMMVPVIFLILPVTVVFAIFPGILAISIGN